MANLYDRYILPHVIACACGAGPIMHQRAKVIPKAIGEVLELGIGGGKNLAFYDPAKVTQVVGVDPSAELRAMALKAERPAGLQVAVEPGEAEALPFADARFDTVVATFTLCSVGDPARALAEARRVLKPGGRFLFCEHGLAPDAEVVKWQRRIEPLWKALAGGCHLTRPVAETIRAAGFKLGAVETMYLPNSPKFASWNEWGWAEA